MKKQTADDFKKVPVKDNRDKPFDWMLLSFIAIVIILLVLMLSYK